MANKTIKWYSFYTLHNFFPNKKSTFFSAVIKTKQKNLYVNTIFAFYYIFFIFFLSNLIHCVVVSNHVLLWAAKKVCVHMVNEEEEAYK